MIKVCFLVGYYPINRGGSEYQAYLLANELKKDYSIFFISIGHEDNSFHENEGFKIYTLRSPQFFHIKPLYFLLKPKINKILKYELPDFIYQRVGYSITGIAAMYCKSNNCKLIWHIAHKNNVEPIIPSLRYFFSFNRIEKKYLEYGIKHADYIIAQAEYQKYLLKKNYNRNCKQVVPNFHPLPDGFREKTPPIKIVWIANIKPNKQPEVFLNLANRFANKDGIKFIMIGRQKNNDWDKLIEAQFAHLKNLEYMGELQIDDVNEVLSTAHIFINTSLSEGFPNTFIQSWLRKVPVISLHIDPDNILRDRRLGFCSKTFENMVKDLNYLIENPELRLKIGERAFKFAINNHSMKNILKIKEILSD